MNAIWIQDNLAKNLKVLNKIAKNADKMSDKKLIDSIAELLWKKAIWLEVWSIEQDLLNKK